MRKTAIFLIFFFFSASLLAKAEASVPIFYILDIKWEDSGKYKGDIYYYSIPKRHLKYARTIDKIDNQNSQGKTKPDLKLLQHELKKVKKQELREKNEFSYLRTQHLDEYHSAIDLIIKSIAKKPLNEITTEESLLLLAKIIRFQFSGNNPITDTAIVDKIEKKLALYEYPHMATFDVMSYEEYFLGGHKVSGYRCGMVSWNAVFIWEYLKTKNPNIKHIYIYEYSIPAPGHSFNLILDTSNNKIFFLDFMIDSFWFNPQRNPERMINTSNINLDQIDFFKHAKHMFNQ